MGVGQSPESALGITISLRTDRYSAMGCQLPAHCSMSKTVVTRTSSCLAGAQRSQGVQIRTIPFTEGVNSYAAAADRCLRAGNKWVYMQCRWYYLTQYTVLRMSGKKSDADACVSRTCTTASTTRQPEKQKQNYVAAPRQEQQKDGGSHAEARCEIEAVRTQGDDSALDLGRGG